MSNPNSLSLSSEDEDDDDGFTPFVPKKRKKLLPLNNNVINFSLNKQKEQQAHQAAAQSSFLEKEKLTAEEEDEDDESPAAKRRKKAGRLLRKLLKRNRGGSELPLKKEMAPKRAGPNIPREKNAEQPVATLKIQPEAAGPASDKTSEVKESEDSLKEIKAEFITPESSKEPAKEKDLSAISPERTPPDLTEKIHDKANLPKPPPLPPPLPASIQATANTGGTRGGGDNLSSLPAAINAADAMPPLPHPALLNQSPALVEKSSSTKAAWTAFLAATYYRRRGEQRTDRKIKQTNDELEQTQIRLKSESRRARLTEQTVRRHDREQGSAAPIAASLSSRFQSEPRLKPLTENQPAKAESHDEAVINPERNTETAAQPVKAAEVVAASPLAREVARKDAAKNPDKTKDTPPAVNNEKPLNPEENAKQERAAQRAAAIERSITKKESRERSLKEAYFDNRHEVKHDTAAYAQAAVAAGKTPSGSKGAPIQPHGQAPLPNLPHARSGPGVRQSLFPSAETPDLYKQSIRAGFLVGLVVSVLGIIAVAVQS